MIPFKWPVSSFICSRFRMTKMIYLSCWRKTAKISLTQRCVWECLPRARLCGRDGPRLLNSHHPNEVQISNLLLPTQKPATSKQRGRDKVRAWKNQQYRISLLQWSSHTMQAVLHISAGVPYPAPSNTSKQRYCLVWMSSVKWWC